MSLKIFNVDVVMVTNGVGVILEGIDEITIEDTTEHSQAFAKDGQGGAVTEVTGKETEDTITISATFLSKSVEDAMKVNFDRAETNPNQDVISLIASDKIDPNKKITLSTATVKKRMFQSVIDDKGVNKYELPFGGKVTEDNISNRIDA